MNREQLVRWCAVRERAMDALAEAQRHMDMMNEMAKEAPFIPTVKQASDEMVVVKLRLERAKEIAVAQAAA